MIPEAVRKLFAKRTKARRGHVGPIPVSGILEAELKTIEPGEVLELDAGERTFGVVLIEDLEYLLERGRMRSRK